jgi:hypothetical protein
MTSSMTTWSSRVFIVTIMRDISKHVVILLVLYHTILPVSPSWRREQTIHSHLILLLLPHQLRLLPSTSFPCLSGTISLSYCYFSVVWFLWGLLFCLLFYSLCESLFLSSTLFLLSFLSFPMNYQAFSFLSNSFCHLDSIYFFF